MKRILLLVMALVICVSLCACANNGSYQSTTIPKETESAEAQMQKLIDYNRALDLLDSTDTYFTFEQVESMCKAYQLLRDLGDYKDSQEILDCFTECTLKSIENNGSMSHQINNANGHTIALLSSDSNTYCTLIYNGKGELVKIDSVSVTGQSNLVQSYTTYDYNEAGKTVKMETVRQFGINNQLDRYTFAYDANGNLITESRYYDTNTDSADDEIIESKTYYSYIFDEQGRIAEERKDNDGKCVERIYTYDEKDQVIEIAAHTSNIEGFIPYTYEYEYDDIGNVIKEKRAGGIYGPTGYSESIYTYATVYIYTPPQT